MAIQINGNGTITGISVGGLPNGIVDTDMIAASAVTPAKSTIVGGKVLQVIQFATDTQDSTYETSYTNTPLSATITPSATSSKVLVKYNINIGTNNAGNMVMFQIVRGSTAVGNGSTGSNRRACHTAFRGQYADSNPHDVTSGEYLDSPNTTSATTYKIQYHVNSQQALINRSAGNADSSSHPTPVSTLTLMEIAA